MDSFNEIFAEKKKVLVVTAHPDDVEINAGGLLAKLMKNGVEVRSVVMTNGIRGTKNNDLDDLETFSKTRIASQLKSGKLLGLSTENNVNLNITDGEVENSLDTIEKLVFQIRQFKPDIVITHNPNDVIVKYNQSVFWANHRDHRNTAISVVDAIYPYSRDTAFFPHHLNSNVTPHSVKEILFFDSFHSEAKKIDITDHLETKRNMLNAHKSANVLTDSDIEVFMNENKMGDRYYEVFGYVVIDRLRTI